MRILIVSYRFDPAFGGMETIGRLLATGLCELGHQVIVVTGTPGPTVGQAGYRIVRRPNWARLFALMAGAEVIHLNGPTLRYGWPLLLLGQPWTFTLHGLLPDNPLGRLKHWWCRGARAIAVSQAIAKDFTPAPVVIPNAYDSASFRRLDAVARNRDLIFVGRLVAEKGLADLLQALARMAADGLRPRLTVLGSGPLDTAMRELATGLGLAAQVDFAGAADGPTVAGALNAHRVLVIPSRTEPFGVVALEGAACGCVVVAARTGGLPEAVGPAGILFPPGDPAHLADLLTDIFSRPGWPPLDASALEAHLRHHQPLDWTRAYLAQFRPIRPQARSAGWPRPRDPPSA